MSKPVETPLHVLKGKCVTPPYLLSQIVIMGSVIVLFSNILFCSLPNNIRWCNKVKLLTWICKDKDGSTKQLS